MARYLFVVPPFAAHIYPLVSVGRELTARGNQVAWVSSEASRRYLPPEAQLYTLAVEGVSPELHAELVDRTSTKWVAGIKAFWEDTVLPMAHRMLPTVEAAALDFQPDVIVADQQALAGPLVARKLGIAWATSSPSAQLLSDAFETFPLVKKWLVGLYDGLQREVGLEPVEWLDRSPDLVLLYTSRYLADLPDAPPSFCFVGPCIDYRPDDTPFPWEQLGQQPRLLVCMGTLYVQRGEHFFAALYEALADQPIQVIVAATPEPPQPAPANFIVRPWLPILEMLPRVDALLCHAGTIASEAMAFGKPLVVAPIALDQSVYAHRFTQRGAALPVRFAHVSPQELADAVRRVLNEPSFRQQAEVVGQSFREAGGSVAASDALEALASGSKRTNRP